MVGKILEVIQKPVNYRFLFFIQHLTGQTIVLRYALHIKNKSVENA